MTSPPLDLPAWTRSGRALNGAVPRSPPAGLPPLDGYCEQKIACGAHIGIPLQHRTKSCAERLWRNQPGKVRAMRAKEIMNREVRACRPSDSLANADRLMWDHDLGCVPVVDDQSTVMGMITDRDICMAAY